MRQLPRHVMSATSCLSNTCHAACEPTPQVVLVQAGCSSPAATASATTSPLGALSLLLLMRLPSGTLMAFTTPPDDSAASNTRKPQPDTAADTSTNSRPYLQDSSQPALIGALQ